MMAHCDDCMEKLNIKPYLTTMYEGILCRCCRKEIK